MQICPLSRLVFLAISLVYASSAFAAESAFYKGKTLTVLINFAAGGPTDIEGRLVGRFIGKHIPGQPQVVVVTSYDALPATKATLGSNTCHVTARVDERTGWVVALAALGRLVKLLHEQPDDPLAAGRCRTHAEPDGCLHAACK